MPFPVSLVGIAGTQIPGDVNVPDTTQRLPLGYKVDFVDPYYGLQVMVYGKAAAIQETGSLTYFDNAFTATDTPNTANLGYPIAVAKAAMAANTYGWYITEGLAPWSSSASVAAGVAFGITGAGTCGTDSAGKQILGARVAVAGTGTFTRAANSFTSTKLQVTDTAGMFIGLAVSGSGVPGGTTIAGIDPSGNFITLSAATTTSVSLTLTCTYTGFLLVYAWGAFGQGKIT